MEDIFFKLMVTPRAFVLTKLSHEGMKIAKGFARRFHHMGMVPNEETRKEVWGIKERYYFVRDDNQEWRFNINALEEFYSYLLEQSVSRKNFHKTTVEPFMGSTVSYECLPHTPPPRDEQPQAIEFVTRDKLSTRTLYIDAQTGTGKTYIAARSFEQFKKRVVACIQPKYLEKWRDEFKTYYGVKDADVRLVRGSNNLIELIEDALKGPLKEKFIIISNDTLRNWIKRYKSDPDASVEYGYPIYPAQLFRVLDAGIHMTDEVHENFHFNFILNLFIDCQLSLSMSATLEDNDKFKEKMYHLLFPKASRFDEFELKRYTEVYSVHYSFAHHRNLKNIRTTERGRNSYSHAAFEKSVMRQPDVLKGYLKMIKYLVDIGYIDRRQPGDKLAVFGATKEMNSIIVDYLQGAYPELVVRRFMQGDPLENLHKSDIRVTTILSGGTAHDIKDLVTGIQTIAIDSVKANKQSYGRLRKLKDRTTKFYYLSCTQIPKHMQYDKRKMLMLRPISAKFFKFNMPSGI